MPELIGLLTATITVIVAGGVNVRANRAAEIAGQGMQTREKAEVVFGLLNSAETRQRGYLLTLDAAILEPYARDVERLWKEFDALSAFVVEDEEQTAMIARVRKLAREKIDELDRTITLARSGNSLEALTIVREGEGRRLMEALRENFEQFRQAEDGIVARYRKRERTLQVINSMAMVTSLLILSIIVVRQYRSRMRILFTARELQKIVEERTADLQKSKLRVESLLKDINHRVGNNLAMISSLLNLQSRQSDDPVVHTALSQAKSRIQAIAAAHRRLHLDLDADELNAREYFRDILADLRAAVEGQPITIVEDIDDIRLSGSDAVSFVIIINEIATNAFKHAFPDDMPGTLRVSFKSRGPNLFLTIEDDGVGYGSLEGRKGLGSVIVADLVRGMDGSINFSTATPDASRPGTRVTIKLPLASVSPSGTRS